MNTNNAELLLNITNVSHNFDYPLFKNINLQLSKKESIAIIGTSGSGKSTLLNIFSSLLVPNEGNVYYKDIDILTYSKSKLLELRRKEFGIIFQSHYLFRGFSANENIKYLNYFANKILTCHF
jgi:putative ABC transport system ATP-binding protein